MVPLPEEPTRAFLWLGIAYLVMSLIGASFFKNPPQGYVVPGYEKKSTGGAAAAKEYDQGEALRTPQWYLLTAILTLNVSVGIALISVAKGSAEGIANYSAAGAATVVGVLAIFNGGGRIRRGAGRVGRAIRVRRTEAGGARRRLAGVEDSPADQP